MLNLNTHFKLAYENMSALCIYHLGRSLVNGFARSATGPAFETHTQMVTNPSKISLF